VQCNHHRLEISQTKKTAWGFIKSITQPHIADCVEFWQAIVVMGSRSQRNCENPRLRSGPLKNGQENFWLCWNLIRGCILCPRRSQLLKCIFGKIQDGERRQNWTCLNRNYSVADCSIALKFGTQVWDLLIL